MLLLDARVCETDKQRVKVEEGVARAPRRFRKDIGLVSIGVEISKRRHAICDRAKKKKKEEEEKEQTDLRERFPSLFTGSLPPFRI